MSQCHVIYFPNLATTDATADATADTIFHTPTYIQADATAGW